MKTEIKYELEENDINHLKDVYFNLHGVNEITKDQICDLFSQLPYDIKLEALKWGLSDTVVRDAIYVYWKTK